MTTNAGSETSSGISGFTNQREMQAKDKTERALASFLRPEFINRIDEIITFRHLDRSDFVRIADIMMGKLKAHMDEQGTKLVYGDDVLAYIAEKSFSEKFGARNMRRFIEREVEDELASVVIERYESRPAGISLSMSDDKIKIDTI